MDWKEKIRSVFTAPGWQFEDRPNSILYAYLDEATAYEFWYTKYNSLCGRATDPALRDDVFVDLPGYHRGTRITDWALGNFSFEIQNFNPDEQPPLERKGIS